MQTTLMRNVFDWRAVNTPKTIPRKASVFNWRNVRPPGVPAPVRKGSFLNFTPARRDADSRR